mmetsp:Transcript_11424/g.53099  ORF Transcript_11424/g.53099 Transcript_11424/m.53099 type:complete len:221 (+) Transcript_11424:5052-5714(+)
MRHAGGSCAQDRRYPGQGPEPRREGLRGIVAPSAGQADERHEGRDQRDGHHAQVQARHRDRRQAHLPRLRHRASHRILPRGGHPGLPLRQETRGPHPLRNHQRRGGHLRRYHPHRHAADDQKAVRRRRRARAEHRQEGRRARGRRRDQHQAPHREAAQEHRLDRRGHGQTGTRGRVHAAGLAADGKSIGGCVARGAQRLPPRRLHLHRSPPRRREERAEG